MAVAAGGSIQLVGLVQCVLPCSLNSCGERVDCSSSLSSKLGKLLGRVLSGVLGGILSPYPCDTTGSNHEAQHTARGGGRQRAARMHAKAIYVFYAEAATGARASVCPGT